MDQHNEEKSTMTKADIVEKVYQKIGFSKKEALVICTVGFKALKLKEGQQVSKRAK